MPRPAASSETATASDPAASTSPSGAAGADWQIIQRALRAWLAARVPQSDLDDVLQDTLARILVQLPKLRDDAAILGWSHRVAQSALVDFYRRRARRLEEALTTEPEVAVGPETLNGEVAAWLLPMLQTLADEDREALELAELAGLSQRELAERWGLSPSGARSRVQRARARLRDKLERCCAIERDRRGNVVDYRAKGSDCC